MKTLEDLIKEETAKVDAAIAKGRKHRSTMGKVFRTAFSILILSLAFSACATVVGVGCGIVVVTANAVQKTVYGD